ncbi:Eukaryotic translation initiation factor 3 subunit L, partial [Galemys pyrenaicus]
MFTVSSVSFILWWTHPTSADSWRYTQVEVTPRVWLEGWMLTYFSLVEHLYLHYLLRDYSQAIKVLRNIKLNGKSMYSCVPKCQVTTNYYVGFENLMIPLHPENQEHVSEDNAKNEEMYVLLAFALTMYPCIWMRAFSSRFRRNTRTKVLCTHQGDGDLFAAPEDFFQRGTIAAPALHQLQLPQALHTHACGRVGQLPGSHRGDPHLVFKHTMKNLVWTSSISALT